ncbi:MAG: GIY-YIG nuclease family protein [Bacteroidetes bacterium]|nr:GIY-YIG nuclease family protein [Bacteroidota bacterium]
MPYYVYILKSLKDGTFYKGFTTDYKKRLEQHNRGESTFTSSKLPWILVFVEEMPDKRTALIREKNLKKADLKRIEAIIISEKNILNKL